MFGLREKSGVGWEGMKLLKVPLFGYKINGWNGMGEDGIIPSNSTILTHLTSPPIWGEWDGME